MEGCKGLAGSSRCSSGVSANLAFKQPQTRAEDADQAKRRSGRQRNNVAYNDLDLNQSWSPKSKRKIGRPIVYKGDPDSPDLTEDERRRIKRRIANRESARRVRAKKVHNIEDLNLQLQEAEAKEELLQEHVTEADRKCESMQQQLKTMHARLQQAVAAQSRLKWDIQRLQSVQKARQGSAQPCLPVLNWSVPGISNSPLMSFDTSIGLPSSTHIGDEILSAPSHLLTESMDPLIFPMI